MGTIFNAEDFWAFSLDFYQFPTIETLCLELQDRHQADVNLVLLCVYAATLKVSLCPLDMADLAKYSGEFLTATIKPLRERRRAIKSQMANMSPDSGEYTALGELRNTVKIAELQAEKIAQQQLIARFNSVCATSAFFKDENLVNGALKNLAIYWHCLALSNEVVGELETKWQSSLIKYFAPVSDTTPYKGRIN